VLAQALLNPGDRVPGKTLRTGPLAEGGGHGLKIQNRYHVRSHLHGGGGPEGVGGVGGSLRQPGLPVSVQGPTPLSTEVGAQAALDGFDNGTGVGDDDVDLSLFDDPHLGLDAGLLQAHELTGLVDGLEEGVEVLGVGVGVVEDGGLHPGVEQ